MSVLSPYFADQALRLANERADGFRREAEMNRQAASARRPGPRFPAISAVLASVRGFVDAAQPEAGSKLPSLIDYPYRG